MASQYAQISDLQTQGVNPAALVGLTNDELNAALVAASGMADDYLGNRYTLPLISPFPASLIYAVCQMAPWIALKARGFNPEGDSTVRTGFEDGLKWCREVSQGRATPVGVIDSSTGPDVPETPIIHSHRPRGW